MPNRAGIIVLILLIAGAAQAVDLNTVLMPAAKLAKIKAALPTVNYPPLQKIFQAPETFWYDATVMTHSYQKTTGGIGFWGAEANAKWFDGIPNQDPAIAAEGRKFVDPEKGRWQFPFSTTAGADDSTNLQTVDFLSLPAGQNGGVTPLVISQVEDPDIDAGMRSWVWTYPPGTVVGEVLFIPDGNDGLLPTEVRIRTKSSSGWSTNVFRPFPTAQDLDDAIKARRPNWSRSASLAKVVAHLESNDALTPKRLAATDLKGTFEQDGYLDVLPDFADPALVRDLLTTTPFVSAYGAVWKSSGDAKTYAASTASPLSIVPINYTAGVIEVSDASCTRCHEDAGKRIDNWTQTLILYGEVWGKDAVFTFHPFDESFYPELAVEGVDDNRHMNPKLEKAGIITWGGSRTVHSERH